VSERRCRGRLVAGLQPEYNSAMVLISVRDLLWRRRRVLVAVVVTGLVFGISLLMAGTEYTLFEDGRRIVRSFDADAWIVADGASGPFTATTPLPAAVAQEVEADAGVEQAAPVVILQSSLEADPPHDVNVIGYDPGAFVAVTVASGRGLEASGEVVADVATGLALGDAVVVGGVALDVVGLAEQVTWYFGTPTVFVATADARAIAFRGQPLAMAIATRGVPQALPGGVRVMDDAAVVADLERPLASSTETIRLLNGLLWVVAAGVIGSMIYLSAIERTRDLAVFKATGATNGALLAGLLLQAFVLCALAGLVGVVVALALAPIFPFTVEIPGAIYLRLVVLVVAVAVVASIGGMRRTARIEPAHAFAGG
jgi:putative ABC transport system permease protein